MSYKVLSSYFVENIEQLVNEHLESGYQLAGGISVTTRNTDGKEFTEYCQAVVEKKASTSTGRAIGITSYIAECKDNDVKPIDKDDAVFKYAADVQIPKEFLLIAWNEFVETMVEKKKKQKSWPQTFRMYVRKNYLKIWYLSDDGYVLTSTGQQAKRKLDAKRSTK